MGEAQGEVWNRVRVRVSVRVRVRVRVINLLSLSFIVFACS